MASRGSTTGKFVVGARNSEREIPVGARRGAVALLTIAVFTAVLITIGLTVAGIGNNEVVLSGIFRDGENAFSIADACAEEGLMRLKSNQAFAGESFPLDGGSCTVAVTHISGNTYEIVGTGQYIDNSRSVNANVTVKFNGQGNAHRVRVNSWQEAD